MTAGRDDLPSRFAHALRRRWPLWLASALAVLLPLAWWLRGPLAERLWPAAEVERLRIEADAALRAGTLS
ncbi:MAG: hypothetical protein ACTHOH_17085, partial [Lysobacteraceae bacterium]